MSFRFVRKQKGAIAQMGLRAGTSKGPATDIFAAWGIMLAHDTSVGGQAYTPTMPRGDPLFVVTKSGSVLWSATWTSDINSGPTTSSFASEVNAVHILPDASVVAVASITVGKVGGTQQTVQIRHANGAVFREFDTLAGGGVQNRCGIGADDRASNTFIAYYDAAGVCQWARRLGINQPGFGGAMRAWGDKSIRYSAARNTVSVSLSYSPSTESAQLIEAGLGEANAFSHTANLYSTSFDFEFSLSSGDLQPHVVVDDNNNATLDNWRTSTLGEPGSTGEYVNSSHTVAAATALSATWDSAGPAPLSNLTPFVTPFKYAHALTRYANASVGPVWTAYLRKPATSGNLNQPVNLSKILKKGQGLYLSSFWFADAQGPASSVQISSVETGLNSTVAFPSAASPTSMNNLLWKINDDGLTGFSFVGIHGLLVGGSPPASFNPNFSPKMLAGGSLVATSRIDPDTGYRLGPSEAGQTDVIAPAGAGRGTVVAFFNEDTLAFQSFIENFATVNTLPEGPATWTLFDELSPTELISPTCVFNGDTRFDILGVNQAAGAPQAGDVGYFGYSIIDAANKTHQSWSGELFGIANAPIGAGVYTSTQAFSARRI